ncbi:peptidyl-prolyl cis-trans isomerase-like [Apium graveolens]|uniref:peptidyl-prolyl cis-trans isomerase-like n=1 Tax=Apium graveolens TaxID=4045 RepID=UPI003D7A11BF
MRNQKVLCDIKIDRNPRVFFDIDINGVHAGRMVMELFADTTPTAAEKFRALGIGENGIGNHGRPLHLKGSCITGSYGLEKYLEGGSDHRGKICCDELFEEEYYGKRHKGPGYLFFREEGTRLFSISLQETWHVVFGKIVDGMDVFRAIDSVNYAMERVKYSERTNPTSGHYTAEAEKDSYSFLYHSNILKQRSSTFELLTGRVDEDLPGCSSLPSLL